jgi:hypothetical protein
MGADKVEQAFPLVRELRHDLTLEAWREYARLYFALKPIDEGHRGIVVAEHAGYLRGLLSYDVLPELFDRKTMAVRDVVVPVLPAGQPAARSLTCFVTGSRETAPQVPAPRRQQRTLQLVKLNP